MMEFDKSVNVAEIMNGVVLCEEAQRIVLAACYNADQQQAILKILKNFDSPKDQVREALLWTTSGEISLANKRPKFYAPEYSAKYTEWKKKDLDRQARIAFSHNEKVLGEYLQNQTHTILDLQRSLSEDRQKTEQVYLPAVIGHFLHQHPVPMTKDGIFLVESKDGKQRSWYLMPATAKIPFFKRVAIFFKLVFGGY